MKYTINWYYEFIVFKTRIMLENHENYLVLKEKCVIVGIEYVSLIALSSVLSSEHN